jgi:TM2 domain-containing membrane protein YozV/Tfp pilus assembly major pilin PilA
MSSMVDCQGCGKEIHKTAAACPQCGVVQHTKKRFKDKTVAGLLAIFLGVFGVHRFYLGKWWGIFYLLLFWTWIPGLIALIEGIVFLFSDSKQWNDKYNEGRPYGDTTGAGRVVGIIACAFMGIAMLGILAAIALPAYQDYTNRAKTAEAYSAANAAAIHVATYALKNNAIPATVQQAGYNSALPASVQSIDVHPETAILRVTMASGSMQGKSFLLEPALAQEGSDKVEWECISNEIEARLLPKQCR